MIQSITISLILSVSILDLFAEFNKNFEITHYFSSVLYTHIFVFYFCKYFYYKLCKVKSG